MALSSYVPEQVDIIRGLVENTINAIRDEKFQRKSCWGETQRNAYEESADKNYILNPILFVDVKKSMEMCKETPGKQKDYKYYKNHYENGVEFLIVDGANRLDTLRLLVEQNSSVVDLRQQGYKVFVCDRETMHEIYVSNAMGMSPNRQEVRTGIFSNTSDLIRELSSNHSSWLLRTKGIKPQRMGDDAFVAGLLTFISMSEFSNDDEVDNFYRLDNFKQKKRLKFILNNIKKYDNILRKTYGNMYEKTYIMGLAVVFDMVCQKKWVLYNNHSFKNFVVDFHTTWTQNVASDTLYTKEGGEKNTFKELLGGLAKGKKQRCLMENFFEPYVNSLVQKDIYQTDVSEDLATPEQRTQLIEEKRDGDFVWVRQNGMVEGKMIFGDLPEFIRVPYLEVLDTTEYQVDHILPKSKGGETILSNMVITTRQYNGVKSDGIPNYSKESLENIMEQYS